MPRIPSIAVSRSFHQRLRSPSVLIETLGNVFSRARTIRWAVRMFTPNSAAISGKLTPL